MKKLLVLWDGDCGFCQNSLEWIKKQRLEGKVEFLSFHDNKAKQWRDKIGLENLKQSMHVIENNQTIYAYSEGFRILFSRSSKWRWLSFLMGLPLIKQCCTVGYKWIAKNRNHHCKLQ